MLLPFFGSGKPTRWLQQIVICRLARSGCFGYTASSPIPKVRTPKQSGTPLAKDRAPTLGMCLSGLKMAGFQVGVGASKARAGRAAKLNIILYCTIYSTIYYKIYYTIYYTIYYAIYYILYTIYYILNTKY